MIVYYHAESLEDGQMTSPSFFIVKKKKGRKLNVIKLRNDGFEGNTKNVLLFSYYETRKKSILVNIELYNVDEQIKNHFY